MKGPLPLPILCMHSVHAVVKKKQPLSVINGYQPTASMFVDLPTQLAPDIVLHVDIYIFKSRLCYTCNLRFLSVILAWTSQ